MTGTTLRGRLLVLVSLACFATLGRCERDDLSLHISGYTAGLLTNFGFARGATAHIDASLGSAVPTTLDTAVQVGLCTAAQVSGSALSSSQPQDLCLGGFNLSCAFTGAVYNGNASLSSPSSSWVLDADLEEDVVLSLVIVSCAGSPVTLNLDYHFVNPGGEELSSLDIPFKPLSVVQSLGWAVLACFITLDILVWWLSPTGLRGDLPALPTITPCVLLAAILRCVAGSVGGVFWYTLSREGVVSTSLWWGLVGADSVSLVWSTFTLLLLGKGLSLTRRSLTGLELRMVWVVFSFLAVAFVFWRASPGLLTVAMLFIAFAIAMRLVYVTAHRNTRYTTLVHRSREASGTLTVAPPAPAQGEGGAAPDPGPAHDPAANDCCFRVLFPRHARTSLQARQASFFTAFQSISLVLLGADVLSVVWSTAATNQPLPAWCGQALGQALALTAFSYMVLHLRLGVLGGTVFFNRADYNLTHLLAPLLAREAGAGEAVLDDSEPVPPRPADKSWFQALAAAWQAAEFAPQGVPGAPVPAPAACQGGLPHGAHGRVAVRQRVVIIQPDNSRSLGTVAVLPARPAPPAEVAVAVDEPAGFTHGDASNGGYALVQDGDQ